MSKTELKKYLKTLSADELVDVILEAYDARKQTKEYFEYYLNPDEKAQVAKINELITKEFYPLRGKRKCRVSGIKKAIKEFEKLYPDPSCIVEVKLNFVMACVYVMSTYWGYSRLEKVALSMFEEALQNAVDYGIWPSAMETAEKIVAMAPDFRAVLAEAHDRQTISEIITIKK